MSHGGLYNEPPPLALVKGIVASNPPNDAVGVYVTIPSYVDPRTRWGPCVFHQKGNTLPTAGTRCLVGFDEDRIPWVLGWVGQTTDVDP